MFFLRVSKTAIWRETSEQNGATIWRTHGVATVTTRSCATLLCSRKPTPQRFKHEKSLVEQVWTPENDFWHTCLAASLLARFSLLASSRSALVRQAQISRFSHPRFGPKFLCMKRLVSSTFWPRQGGDPFGTRKNRKRMCFCMIRAKPLYFRAKTKV